MSNGPSRAAEADFTPITPARLQWQDHTPVATDFDDPYFSRHDGRAESLYVFLDGNQLDRRFAALADGDRFVIGETGFGTGLNMLLAAQRFLALAPAGASARKRWAASSMLRPVPKPVSPITKRSPSARAAKRRSSWLPSRNT